MTIVQDSFRQMRWAVRNETISVLLPTEPVAQEFLSAYQSTPEAPPNLEWTEDIYGHWTAAAFPYGLRFHCWKGEWWADVLCHANRHNEVVACCTFQSIEEAKSGVERIVSALLKMGLNRLGRVA